jgi:hypothetical protein
MFKRQIKRFRCWFSSRAMWKRKLLYINVAEGGSFVRDFRIIKLSSPAVVKNTDALEEYFSHID